MIDFCIAVQGLYQCISTEDSLLPCKKGKGKNWFPYVVLDLISKTITAGDELVRLAMKIVLV